MKVNKGNLGKTIFLALTLVALPAYADESEAKRNDALALYEKGKVLMKVGEFAKAEQEYNASLQTFSMPKTRGMLGYVQVQQGKYLDGVRNLEWFFQEDTTVDVEKREQVRPQYILAKKNVATIKLKIAPLDATVSIDGVTIPANQVPWPQYVGEGKHTVVVKKDGFVSDQQGVTLGIGTETEVELKLVASVVPRQGQIDVKLPPKSAKISPLVMAAWIGSGVFGAVAIGTGIGATQTYAPMEDAWFERGANCKGGCEGVFEPRRVQLEALSTTSLVSGTLSLGALGYALYGTLSRPKLDSGVGIVPTINGAILIGRW